MINKIFCINCKHVSEANYLRGPSCKKNPEVVFNPVFGAQKRYLYCENKNGNFDCKDYEEKKEDFLHYSPISFIGKIIKKLTS